jgi:hypothetical protein
MGRKKKRFKEESSHVIENGAVYRCCAWRATWVCWCQIRSVHLMGEGVAARSVSGGGAVVVSVTSMSSHGSDQRQAWLSTFTKANLSRLASSRGRFLLMKSTSS